MKKILILFTLIYAVGGIDAQNMTNSPSSMFGLGEISTGDGGLYAGMGGVSIALRSTDYLSASNPASLTAIGNKKFLFNVGVVGAMKEFTQSNATNNSFVGNVNNIGLGSKILSRWYSAITLSPVSSIGYNIALEQQIDGSPGSTITSQFEGDGGMSRITFSNAFLVTRRLSVGVNLSYSTGSVTQTETQGTAAVQEKSEKQAVHADFGAQYVHTLNSKQSVTLGVIYGYSQRVAQDNSRSVASNSSSETIVDDLHSVKQYFPAFYGAGTAYYSTRWIATAEYKYMDWSKMKSSKSIVRYDNQHRLSLGASYLIGNAYKLPKQIMVGAGYYNSYVVIKDEKPKNYYISAGFGFTVPNGSILSFGIKYNDQFNVSNNTQKERAFSLFLNMAFNERSYRAKLK